MLANLNAIRERIGNACRKAGRPASDVRLIAVSKTFPLGKIEEAAGLGLTEFGESRIQEAENKIDALRSSKTPLRWHMIGHLQRNKARRAVELFDCIQSLDSIRLAEAVNRLAAEAGKTQECLAEVKISDDPEKTGLAPRDLQPFLDACAGMKNIQISGLMCIPPYFDNPESTRPFFAKARTIFEKQFLGDPRTRAVPPVLSMGMSHDFEVAIEEGSTMVRIGTALFGERI